LNQTLQLANGRTLGFAVYGHPGSRLELTLFDGLDIILTRLNLRIIAVERPGVGE
jgi:hypothetical protein